MVAAVGDAVRFMETISGEALHNLNRADFYTSHEALLLPYEEALTRQVPRQWGWFNLSTHFPWIGMRTAALDGAHVEYFRGIRNPGRGEDRAVGDAGAAAAPGDAAQPRQRARAPELHPAHGRGEGGGEAAGAGAGGAARGPSRAVGVRPDARQHREHHERLQDAALRQYPPRARTAASTSMPRSARAWAACTWS
jgi:hypothetical protein